MSRAVDIAKGFVALHKRRIVGQPRGTQRHSVIVRADEDALTRAITALAAQYGRYPLIAGGTWTAHAPKDGVTAGIARSGTVLK